jgi:ubiquinone/menaquinone biosynthesis C-methylase UbiE
MDDKNNPSSQYILGTGGQGARNLDLQHEILKEESFAQLRQAGLAQNMVVWDIGCGSGVMTEYLAGAVGAEGLVYALDISEEQINVTKKRIAAAGYKNVQFIVGDINSLDASQHNKADIVHSRLILMHVHNPEETIKLMASLLKEGGVISLQESSMNAIEEHPSDPSIHAYYRLMVDYGKLKGFDYSIGRKLTEICNNLGAFSKVNSYTRDYQTTDHIKELLSRRLPELQDKLVSANLITQAEYIQLSSAIKNFLNSLKANDCLILAELSHVLAYK